ncbi:MAG: DUF6713 family protein [Myxococcota bacterium]
MANSDSTPSRYLDLLFFTGLALLLCHELDAVAQSEWRLLPYLSTLPDGEAYTLFVLLHIPLFALLLWWAGSLSAKVRKRTQLTIDAFMVFHAGLHFALRHQADYTFHSTLSEMCIFGAGAVGLLHAVLRIRQASIQVDR